MPEVGGEAAIYVDPFSVESIKRGMSKAIKKEAFNYYREIGLVQAKKFDWQKSAEIIWGVIKGL